MSIEDAWPGDHGALFGLMRSFSRPIMALGTASPLLQPDETPHGSVNPMASISESGPRRVAGWLAGWTLSIYDDSAQPAIHLESGSRIREWMAEWTRLEWSGVESSGWLFHALSLHFGFLPSPGRQLLSRTLLTSLILPGLAWPGLPLT